MEITFSQYLPKDKRILQEFIEKLQDYIVSLDTQDRVIRDRKFGKCYTEKLLRQIQSQGGMIFFAKDEEKLVGMVIAVVLKRSEEDGLQLKDAKYGEIEKLFVLAEYRSLGIGKQLLEMAEEYLIKQAKCDYIEIVVFGDNKKAYDLYKNLGYADREFVLIKRVSQS